MNTKPEINELEKFDLEFTTFSVNEIQEVKEYQERLSKIKKMIIPFLEKLMKDPDKDIHWPNRDVKIGKFKSDIEDIIDYGKIMDRAIVVEEMLKKVNVNEK